VFTASVFTASGIADSSLPVSRADVPYSTKLEFNVKSS